MPDSEGQKADDRRQRAEDRSRKTDDRRLMMEEGRLTNVYYFRWPDPSTAPFDKLRTPVGMTFWMLDARLLIVLVKKR